MNLFRNIILAASLLFSVHVAAFKSNNSHAAVFGIPRGGMQLFVKTLTGKTVTIDVCSLLIIVEILKNCLIIYYNLLECFLF